MPRSRSRSPHTSTTKEASYADDDATTLGGSQSSADAGSSSPLCEEVQIPIDDAVVGTADSPTAASGGNHGLPNDWFLCFADGCNEQRKLKSKFCQTHVRAWLKLRCRINGHYTWETADAIIEKLKHDSLLIAHTLDSFNGKEHDSLGSSSTTREILVGGYMRSIDVRGNSDENASWVDQYESGLKNGPRH